MKLDVNSDLYSNQIKITCPILTLLQYLQHNTIAIRDENIQNITERISVSDSSVKLSSYFVKLRMNSGSYSSQIEKTCSILTLLQYLQHNTIAIRDENIQNITERISVSDSSVILSSYFVKLQNL